RYTSFCYYSSRPRPHLHSFPTRRSSDLHAQLFQPGDEGQDHAHDQRTLLDWQHDAADPGEPARATHLGRLLWLAPELHHGCDARSEEHTSELQSQSNLVCRLLLEKKKKQ